MMQADTTSPSQLSATALRAAMLWGSGIGAATYRDLYEVYESDVAIAGAAPADLRRHAPRIEPSQAEAICESAERVGAIARQVVRLSQHGVRVITDACDDYPSRLRALSAPPPLLCVRGQIPGGASVAIVGTRSPSSEDASMAHALARECAARGICVVSGLAIGIDTAAHVGALSGDGQTVAVLGCGIRHVYPRRNRRLAERIASSGAVVSETPPRARVSVPSLMARNRITAALADALIVVASGETGGSMATVRHARQLGIPIAAVKWARMHPKREGNERLIAEGAVALGGVEDIELVV